MNECWMEWILIIPVGFISSFFPTATKTHNSALFLGLLISLGSLSASKSNIYYLFYVILLFSCFLVFFIIYYVLLFVLLLFFSLLCFFLCVECVCVCVCVVCSCCLFFLSFFPSVSFFRLLSFVVRMNRSRRRTTNSTTAQQDNDRRQQGQQGQQGQRR